MPIQISWAEIRAQGRRLNVTCSSEVVSGTLNDFFRYHGSPADIEQRIDIERAFANKKRGGISMIPAANDPDRMVVFTNRELFVRFGTMAFETQKKLLQK